MADMKNDVAKAAEELVKFTFFARNKDLSKKEICGGPIYATVYIDGNIITVYTTLSEEDVTHYRETNVFDFI